MKQTAVDYIRQHFIMDEEFEKLFQDAKKMEKEQIQDAFDTGLCEGYVYGARLIENFNLQIK